MQMFQKRVCTFNYRRRNRRVFTREYLEPLAAYVRHALKIHVDFWVTKTGAIVKVSHALPPVIVISHEENYNSVTCYGRWPYLKVPNASYDLNKKRIFVDVNTLEREEVSLKATLIHELVHYYYDKMGWHKKRKPLLTDKECRSKSLSAREKQELINERSSNTEEEKKAEEVANCFLLASGVVSVKSLSEYLKQIGAKVDQRTSTTNKVKSKNQ